MSKLTESFAEVNHSERRKEIGDWRDRVFRSGRFTGLRSYGSADLQFLCRCLVGIDPHHEANASFVHDFSSVKEFNDDWQSRIDVG